MSFEQISAKYILIFYVLGLSKYNPPLKKSVAFVDVKSNFRAGHLIVRVWLYLFVISSTFFYFSEILQYTRKDLHATVIVARTLSAFQVFFGYACLIESAFSKRDIGTIHTNLSEINYIFEHKLQQDAAVKKFGKTYIFDALTVILVWAVSFVALAKFDLNLQVDSSAVALYGRSLRGLMLTYEAHILVYCDLTRHFVGFFCESMENMACLPMSNIYTKQERLILQLRYCKIVHYKLWKTTQLITSTFGWTMILTCMVNAILGSNALFRAFMYANTGFDQRLYSNFFFISLYFLYFRTLVKYLFIVSWLKDPYPSSFKQKLTKFTKSTKLTKNRENVMCFIV